MKADWDPETVVADLRPLAFTGSYTLTPQLAAYLHYYRLEPESFGAGVKHRIGFFNCLDYRIATHHFYRRDSLGTCFIVHGYFDHVGLYRHLIEFLLNHRYDVVAFDLPGHGLSSGEQAAINRFSEYQHVLQDCLNLFEPHATKPWHACGQSTGGAILIDYLLSNDCDEHDCPFQQVLLMAPLVRPFAWNLSSAFHSLVGPFFQRWKRAYTDNSNNKAFIDFLRHHDPLQASSISVKWVSALKRWIPAIEDMEPVDKRIVVIQGEHDRTVDWRHNIDVLQQKFHHVDVHYLQGACHHLVNETEDTRVSIFQIMESVLTDPRSEV